MNLKELREATIEEIKKEIEKENGWAGIHIRIKYECGVKEWIERIELEEEIWG